MKIPVPIICIFLGAVVTLQGWTLQKVQQLDTRVAVLSSKLGIADTGKPQPMIAHYGH